MFKTLRDALKIKEIRTRIFYTFVMLVIFRIGCLLPVPGVKTSELDALFTSIFNAESGGISNFFNTITGGSYTNMSVFALNIF